MLVELKACTSIEKYAKQCEMSVYRACNKNTIGRFELTQIHSLIQRIFRDFLLEKLLSEVLTTLSRQRQIDGLAYPAHNRPHPQNHRMKSIGEGVSACGHRHWPSNTKSLFCAPFRKWIVPTCIKERKKKWKRDRESEGSEGGRKQVHKPQSDSSHFH